MLKVPFIFAVCVLNVLMVEGTAQETFKETSEALKRSRENRPAPKLDLEVLDRPESKEVNFSERVIPTLDTKYNRVLPSKEKERAPRLYGKLPAYGVSGMFYRPKMRSAQVLNPKQWDSYIGYSHSKINIWDSNAEYTSSIVDLELKQIPMSFSYGFSFAELQVSGGMSELSGELSLVDNTFTNMIQPVSPEMSMDDVQIDWFIDLNTLLWKNKETGFGAVPKGKHVFSVGMKLPMGKEHKYLSSGSFDFSLGSYNSFDYTLDSGRVVYLDLAAQLVFLGDVDSQLFQDRAKSRSFISTQSFVSTEVFEQTRGFLGAGYRSRSMNGPFDAYRNQGFEFFLGLEREVIRNQFKIKPKIQASMLDKHRLAAQANLGVSF